MIGMEARLVSLAFGERAGAHPDSVHPHTLRDKPVTAAMRSMVNYIKQEITELSASGAFPREYFKPFNT